MRTLRSFLDEAWCDLANVPYEDPELIPPLDQIKKEEWVPEFIEYMSNRMVFGRFRYGPIKRQELDSYDFPEDAIRRIKLYQEDDNLEHLVDVGNEMMIEFFKGRQAGKNMISVDDGTHNKKVI